MTEKPCRRGALKAMLAAAALVPPSGHAEGYKMGKKQAGYVDRKKPATLECSGCIYFIQPNDCVIVKGPVSPYGWCTYYGD